MKFKYTTKKISHYRIYNLMMSGIKFMLQLRKTVLTVNNEFK